MSGFENHESIDPPNQRPELGLYLEANQDIDPSSLVVLHHIPVLLGGAKSSQFIIREQGADDDTPPNPDARIDLGEVTVPRTGLAAFADAFTDIEGQADANFDVALLETQQIVAEMNGDNRGVQTLFVPDTVNFSATGYFNRLKRLAQNTGIDVVIRVVDYDDDLFKRFEPVRAASVNDYWNERAHSLRRQLNPPLDYGSYAVYTMEAAYEIEKPPTAESLSKIALPTKPPLVFTSFEQIKQDYPDAPISDPVHWEENKQKYTLVKDDDEYMAVSRQRDKEDSELRWNLYNAATASSTELRQLLLGSETFKDSLSVIRELAMATTENSAMARVIMAKLGDSSTAQLILSELQNQSGGFGDESLTSVPLGIYLRQDPSMLSEILREVTDTIERAPDSSHRLLPLLGALHYSHDLQIGELLAGYLTIPERNKESYANVVLHAAIRWLPQYTMAIAHMPFSAQQQRTFAAISRQTALFVDAHNRGELDNLHTFYDPGILLSLLFWFSNPAHHGIVQQSVRKRFQEGGSVITDNHFEHAYLMYRAQYGDLPEMAQYIHPA